MTLREIKQKLIDGTMTEGDRERYLRIMVNQFTGVSRMTIMENQRGLPRHDWDEARKKIDGCLATCLELELSEMGSAVRHLQGLPPWTEDTVIEPATLKLYYLSFATADAFLGACFVRAYHEHLAIPKTHELGINPGGSVLVMLVEPNNEAAVPEEAIGKLLDLTDLKTYGLNPARYSDRKAEREERKQ